ncbi:TadE/TadG family type IV pilus assembly protein [Occultella kanbiaonis]|uniref:TadE/TadG family type IV pilus assembly protein n=1 Tax=Occultella kanbiaonis TaxID=2675754 RepID=UPI0012B8D8FA|nr:TadE/TadG family type IV pilus assembly protein [Occultella kanbiaonis]
MNRRADLGRDRGSMTVESAILAVAFVLLLGTVIGVGRVGLARNTIDQVAHDAARIASIARTGQQASLDAHTAAEASITDQGLACSPMSVQVDTGGFASPAGTPAQLDVVVTCAVPLADLLLPFAPGTLTLTATASRAIDTYRERS